jgi:ABC-type Mn2+/Zn2+ transport system ATPase subunit
MTGGTIIKFTDVATGYGNQIIHEGINVAIERNDFIGIVGPNGSGKTTFLKTLLGNLKPVRGQIERSNLIFGYVPQRDMVQPILPYTVHDVVLMGRYPLMGTFRFPSEKDRKMVGECLERVGISDLEQSVYHQLSGGQRQRTLIARALVSRPDVLILDEPTNGMDTPSHHALLRLIADLQLSNRLTVLLVSHLLTDVANLVKKLMLFEKGHFRIGPIAELLTEKNLEQIYSADLSVRKIDGDYLIIPKHGS